MLHHKGLCTAAVSLFALLVCQTAGALGIRLDSRDWDTVVSTDTNGNASVNQAIGFDMSIFGVTGDTATVNADGSVVLSGGAETAVFNALFDGGQTAGGNVVQYSIEQITIRTLHTVVGILLLMTSVMHAARVQRCGQTLELERVPQGKDRYPEDIGPRGGEGARCQPSSVSSLRRTSSVTRGGRASMRSASRARQSRLFTWSESTTPEISHPAGRGTSKG